MKSRDFYEMYYLIRKCHSKEVLGIISADVVFDMGDWSDMFKVYSEGRSDPILRIIKAKFLSVIEWNVGRGVAHWRWEQISKAEYETYRDLHEFMVFGPMQRQV